MNESSIAKKVFKGELIRVRRVGRPHKRQIDTVREILGYKCVTLEKVEEIVHK